MMYYKYFTEQTKGSKIKQIVVDIIKSVIYAFILTLLLGYAIGFRPVYIIGDSMTPEVMKYDLILIKSVKQDKIKVGDVITYAGGSSGESKTTHRIFGIENGIFYTKDEPTVLNWKQAGKTFSEMKSKCEAIKYEDVLGKYVYRSVVLGDIVEYMTENNGKKVSITSVFEVLLTIVAITQILAYFKQSENKYYSKG